MSSSNDQNRPETIAPNSEAQFVVCSSFAGGTEGDVGTSFPSLRSDLFEPEYSILDNNTMIDTFILDWKNPLIGSKATVIKHANRADGRFRVEKADEKIDSILELTINVFDKLGY